MSSRLLSRVLAITATALAVGLGAPLAQAALPGETYEALGLTREASTSALYDALVKRYTDPQPGAGKGSFADLWEPIPFSRYMDPRAFYQPPDLDITARREDCVVCHQAITPGWVHSWQASVHGRLAEIRKLPDGDSRSYKRKLIGEVELNLQSLGLLKQGSTLGEVGCIDCHMGVGKAQGNHKTDLHMPDAANCGQCHVQQFAERESERDTQTWPQNQWPAGRPSHALAWKANVETAIWAGMAEREVAEGCSMCHTSQNTCNSCHTRHEFSAAEARRPEACSTCHMEYDGQYSHNLVRKVRWGFNPMQSIADNLKHPWFEQRKEAWLTTCAQCHSPSFARAYFEMIDKGTTSGIGLVEQARKVMTGLHDDKLLVGQTTNRPAPPRPDKDEAGGFFSFFFSQGNNPTAIDVEFAEMWEQHMMKHFKGLAHANPGGFTIPRAGRS